MCMVYTCNGVCLKVGGQPVGVCYLFPPCGCQAWEQAPLPAQPSCWPRLCLEKIAMARLSKQCSGLEFELWELDTCWLWTKEVMVNQKSLSFQFKISQSWGDGVVSKVLIAWTWGPEFWPRTHVKSKKAKQNQANKSPPNLEHSCNSCGPQGSAGPPVSSTQQAPDGVRVAVPKVNKCLAWLSCLQRYIHPLSQAPCY